MKSHRKYLSLRISERMGFQNITQQVADEVEQSGVKEFGRFLRSQV